MTRVCVGIRSLFKHYTYNTVTFEMYTFKPQNKTLVCISNFLCIIKQNNKK